MCNELELDRYVISDAFPIFMAVGDVIRLIIRDHLADFGYRAGCIDIGRDLSLTLRFFGESAHDCLMICALAGGMDWRVDERKCIHVWRETDL